MMLQWMAYAALCAALFAGAAACVEYVCASHHRARRGVWLVAIVLSVIVPIASPARNVSVAAPAIMATVPTMSDAPAAQPPQIDLVVLTAWATASLLFAALLLVAHWRTSIVLRSCRRGSIGGRAAFISRDFGPAVVGVFRHHIVVPEWVLALGESEQQFIVLHELEHARSSDPALALAGVCAVIAMPWNVALWWQLSRLRLAIEVDCDARVVALKQSNVIAYGQLLLCVRERGYSRRHPVLALSHSRSSLAKRLDALLDRRTRQGRGQLTALATLAVCIAASVAFIPAPRVQTVLHALRKTRVEPPAFPAGSVKPAPGVTLTEVPVTGAMPSSLAIKRRNTTARATMRPTARAAAGLKEVDVPPMSVVPANPLGLIAPAAASPVALNPPRGAVMRRGVLRADPSMAGGRVGGGAGGGGGRGGFAAAAGRARGGGGVQPALTEVPVDSARGGVIRATGRGGVVVVPRPDSTRPPR
jgi:beta-lactamase regulating signal transducer with metallopeptidase domain